MAEYDLKSAIQKIKTHPVNFGLYRGSDKNQVVLTPRPPGDKLLKGVEEDCGGELKRVAKGLCFWENGKLTFATKSEPGPNWELMIVACFKKEKCSQFLPVVLRKLGATESDEVITPDENAAPTAQQTGAPATGTEPTGPATADNVAEAERFKARVQALGTDLAKAIAAKTPEGDAVKLKASEAAVFSRKNDFVQAHALLDEVERMLKAPASAVPQPQASGAAQPTDGGNDLKTKYEAGYAAVNPRYTAAVKDGRGDVGKMRAVDAFIQEKAAAGNYQAAIQGIAGMEKLLAAAGPATAAPTGAEPGKGAEEQTTDTAGAEFKARVQALVPKLKEALLANAAGGDDERQRVLDANALGAKKQYAEANALLDQVEKWLATTKPADVAGTGTTETPAEPDQETDFKAMSVWQNARDIVNGQLGKLQSKLRETQDPDFARIAEYGLNGITKRLQVGLQVALMELDGTQGEARDKAALKARAALKEFESFLDKDRMITVIEDNPFLVPVTLRSTLGKAIARIQKSLKK